MNAVFFAIFGYGHLTPCIPILEGLKEKGVKITTFSVRDTKRDIQNITTSYGSIRPFLDENGEEFPFAPPMPVCILKMVRIVPSLLKILREEIKPDFLLMDSMYSLGVGSIVAKELDIPCISLCTCPASFYKNISEKFSVLPNKDEVKKLFQQNEMYGNLEDIKKLSVTFSFPEIEGDLVNDPNVLIVGAMSINRTENVGDFPIERLNKKKVIYISMGTVFSGAKNLLNTLCESLIDDTDLIVVVSLGASANLDDFKNLPDNFICRNFVPQLEVLKKTSVFVTHGGWNSTTEALFFAVPLIFIPQMMHSDQPFNAKFLSDLGVGIHLPGESLTKENFRKAVFDILQNSESFSENCKKLGKSMQNCGGAPRAIDGILKFVEKSKR